jgi:hypothetical protein
MNENSTENLINRESGMSVEAMISSLTDRQWNVELICIGNIVRVCAGKAFQNGEYSNFNSVGTDLVEMVTDTLNKAMKEEREYADK